MESTLKKILIIEDVELNRAILRDAFEKNFEILEAENGCEGVEIIEKEFDNLSAIFLDIIMPKMDGFGVLQHIENKEFLRQIPVFLITIDASSEVVERAYNYGVVDVIPKPFNLQIIKRRVMNIIEMYENRNQLETLFNASQEVISSKDLALEKNNEKLVELLGNAVESRSAETGSHVRRIKRITEILAKTLSVKFPVYGLYGKKIKDIANASVLHDIGKISIPDNILNKPESMGRLTAEEFEIMKTHTTAGVKLLDPVKDNPLYRYYYDICLYHHERWDGRGYPSHLKENEIPISAQIVSIADVFDALICKRVYKPAFTKEVAIEMINNGDCGQFNPDILTAFNACVEAIYSEIYQKEFDNNTFTI